MQKLSPNSLGISHLFSFCWNAGKELSFAVWTLGFILFSLMSLVSCSCTRPYFRISFHSRGVGVFCCALSFTMICSDLQKCCFYAVGWQMFHPKHFHTHLLHHQGESITSVSISTSYQLCITSIYVVLAASPFSKDLFLHTRDSSKHLSPTKIK